MKKFVILLCLVVAVGPLVWLTPLRETINQSLLTSTCNQPVTYSVGTVDSRFNIPQSSLVADIQSATTLWSQAEGKQLFKESPDAKLKVNFVYDQRQQLDTQIQQLQNQLDSKNSSLQEQIQSYYQQQADFKQKLADLNSQVQSWNDKGGAPPDVYKQLTQEQDDLKTQATQLNAIAQQLNLSTNEYNTQVDTLNQDVNQFNDALSQKPEEGLYDPNTQTITIYFASNQSELIHTLAHEFGHSLGIEHVEDPNAIMYPYTSKSTSLTQDDKNQLTYVCREQYVFLIWRQNLQLWLHYEIQSILNHQF